MSEDLPLEDEDTWNRLLDEEFRDKIIVRGEN